MNNRPIKFKIWSISLKRYITDLFLVNLANPEFDQLNDIFDNKNLIFQQYTGLNDKNNKEIYEGDTILFKLSYSEMMESGGENDIDTVILKDGCFRFQNGDFLSEYIEENGRLDSCEIIGNVLDNIKNIDG